MTKSIGIVGQGFVGSAIREGLKNYYNILTYDLEKDKCNSNIEELVKNCEIIFQCLPTPMKKKGECDLKIVKNSLRNIEKEAQSQNKTPIVVIKSTVPPGTTEKLNRSCENIIVLFSPEFLTEANHIDDFKNQTRIIIGGPRPATGKVKAVLRRAFPRIPIVKTGYRTAEMVKYFLNNFLTIKVMFANEIFQICSEMNIDYDKVTEYALYDKRIGPTHLSVPGPDGEVGYGGHCFPKDIAAMIYLAESLGLEPEILKAAENKNDKIRENKDWLTMKGRAVSEED
jgi:UDPglucose 6-dehydrogenase